MRVPRLILCILSVTLLVGSTLLTSTARAQVNRQSLFSGVQADTNARVTVDTPVQLPADHAPHWPFQLEWWYFTLLLEDEQGVPFNYQFTLFKFARPDMQSHWGDGAVWMAHSSLHSGQAHWFNEKFAQHGTATAGFSLSPIAFYIDDWRWQSSNASSLFPATLHSSAGNATLRLQLDAEKPFVLHGEQGVSDKTADGKYRSYYYSQPFITANGTITVNDELFTVKGIGWYDHEWTSQLADENALGWDWFSLHFDDGSKLMAFTMHVKDSPPYTTGTLISATGESVTLDAEALIMQAKSTGRVQHKTLPLSWQIQIPGHGVDIVTTPFKADQWNASRFPYYEGAIEFSGSHTGKGFMELTGY